MNSHLHPSLILFFLCSVCLTQFISCPFHSLKCGYRWLAFVHPTSVPPPSGSTALILLRANDPTSLQSMWENWLLASSSRFGLDNQYSFPPHPYPRFFSSKIFLDGYWNSMPDLLWFTGKKTSLVTGLVSVRTWQRCWAERFCLCVRSMQRETAEKWGEMDRIGDL